MKLEDWCSYDYHWGLVKDCSECNLCDACNNCKLHCNYQVFSDLTKLETREEVNAEMDRMLSFYNNPECKQRGKYFWEWEFTGQGHTWDPHTQRWVIRRRDE